MCKRFGWPWELTFHPERLPEPLHWKKPSRIFVCSMGDIFHEKVKPEWLDAIWEVMAACPQHTFMVLTKRPQNIDRLLYGVTEECGCRELGGGNYLPNLWLGVSISNQQDADKNIPILLQISAAKRFVSVEPMLGAVDFRHIKEETGFTFDALSKKIGISFRGVGLDWIIVGGETGPGARPLHPDWVRSIRDQCQAAGVPLFIKTFPVNGKVSNQISEWPEDVRIRSYPNAI
jgi:protein gp37